MKLNWKSALGIALSAGLLVWTLARRVAVRHLGGDLAVEHAAARSLAALVATSIFPLRAIRWRVILEPVAPDLPVGQLWRATAVGMMVNNIYPARLGEIARAYALTRETNRVSLTSAVASLAVDRVFDALALMLLLVSAMLAPEFPQGIMVGGQPVQRGAALFAAGASQPARRPLRHRRVSAVLARLYAVVVGRLAPGLVQRGSKIIHAFSEGLGVLEARGGSRRVFFWALVALARECARLLDRLQGRRHQRAVQRRELSCRASSPSASRCRQSPGFFGVFEVGGQGRAGGLQRTGDTAVSWAIGYHVLSFIPITLIGLYYFARLGLHFSDFKAQPNEAR